MVCWQLLQQVNIHCRVHKSTIRCQVQSACLKFSLVFYSAPSGEKKPGWHSSAPQRSLCLVCQSAKRCQALVCLLAPQEFLNKHCCAQLGNDASWIGLQSGPTGNFKKSEYSAAVDIEVPMMTTS